MHLDIVLMHPVAGLDGRLGEADDLSEFADRLAFGDRHDCHLMPARHARIGDNA